MCVSYLHSTRTRERERERRREKEEEEEEEKAFVRSFVRSFESFRALYDFCAGKNVHFFPNNLYKRDLRITCAR